MDLRQSEILVDHKNYYVSIKIPHPKMTFIPLYDQSETLLSIDNRKTLGIFKKKDSQTGLDIAQAQESSGYENIYEKLADEEYAQKADEAAITGLTRLVKSLNNSIEDKLIIEITFID